MRDIADCMQPEIIWDRNILTYFEICSSFLNIAYHGVCVWHVELWFDGMPRSNFARPTANIWRRTNPWAQETHSDSHFLLHDRQH
jgi:hypothetical protein